MSTYYNCEDSEYIICPYCGKEYDPSYDDTWIGDEGVDCYTEDTNFYVCDVCHKKFSLTPYMANWRYRTETVDGEMTEEDADEMDVNLEGVSNE